jgi:tRNA pseudouridine13 synthase
MPELYSLDWPHAHGKPKSTASFKQTPEDFQVNEYFTTEFSGTGEHILVRVEKRGLSTEELTKSFSKMINKPTKLISYAGLKDRQALTTQWLSIHAPGEEIDGIETLQTPSWRVLECTRHHKKLRPGFLTGNHFVIQLRNISDTDDLINRIELITCSGVPNYFGDQRFGRVGNNLFKAEEMLVKKQKVKDRFLKGIYLSAARSWLYNLILSKRVRDNTWNKPLVGDVMQLSGSNSIFVIDTIDPTLLQRINEKDISPASPLPGKGKDMVSGTALELINEVYADWMPWMEGLEQNNLEESWRANILNVENMKCSVDDGTALLSFTLPAGAYATSVLRELCCLD